MPFLAEKVVQMLSHVLSKGDTGGEVDITEVVGKMGSDSKVSRMDTLKNKVKSVGRMQRMYTTLRNESELILKLKGMAPDGKIPRGLLLQGRPAIKDALREFHRARELDKVNEKRPTKK